MPEPEFTSLFVCDRLEMPVAKDTTDCIGCGFRENPSPCKQFAYYHRLAKQGALGYIPSIFSPDTAPPDVTE